MKHLLKIAVLFCTLLAIPSILADEETDTTTEVVTETDYVTVRVESPTRAAKIDKSPSEKKKDNSFKLDSEPVTFFNEDEVTTLASTDDSDETSTVVENETNSKNSSEIVGKPRLASRAERVSPAECPYYAAIQVSGKHTCGGALISPKHVLTAAHCIQPLFKNPYVTRQIVVEVGTVVKNRGQSYSPSRLSYYRNYQPINPYSQYIQPNDVAVITLAQAVQQSAYVKVINLPSANSQVPTGAKVKVSGMGNARVGGPTSSVLQKSNLYVVSFSECINYYSSYLGKAIDSNSQICAKRGSGYGACQGDSGGPLVYNNQVVGLVSAGDGQCGAGNPDIYTRVSSFISYIQSELNGGDESQSISLDVDGGAGSYPGQSQYPSYPGSYPGAAQRPTVVQNPYYPTVVQQKPSMVGGDRIQYYPIKKPSTVGGDRTQYYPGQQPSEQNRYYPSVIQNPSSQTQYYPSVIQSPSTQTQYYPSIPSQGRYPQYNPTYPQSGTVVGGQYNPSQGSVYYPSQVSQVHYQPSQVYYPSVSYPSYYSVQNKTK